jgi:hypothetical protein
MRYVDETAERVASIFENEDPVVSVMILRRAAVIIERGFRRERRERAIGSDQARAIR